MRQRIVILTGAGVSAESGLGTFRDTGGIWSHYDLADVATPEGYQRDAGLVLGFYNARRENMAAAVPNAAHDALSALCAAPDVAVTLVTQNIDDLHERAGTEGVIHMHGALAEALCASCGHVWPWQGAMALSDSCPECHAVGRVRPNVVWFGEIPYHMERIAAALKAADLFVSIGTSGAVYPAAGFVAEAAQRGIPTLELNLEPSDGAAMFDEGRYGPATRIVPEWVAEILTQPSSA